MSPRRITILYSPDIRKQLWITLLVIILYRLLAAIPLPGMDQAAWRSLLASGGSVSTVAAFLNLLSGGTLEGFSILALGLSPYFTAHSIMEKLVPIIPSLARRMAEFPSEGRRVLHQWRMLLTLPLVALQALGLFYLVSRSCGGGWSFLPRLGFRSDPLSIATLFCVLAAGSYLAVWLSQVIDRFGIRNCGFNVIVLSGIAVNLRSGLLRVVGIENPNWVALAVYLAVLVALIFIAVNLGAARRNIPILFPGRQYASRMSVPIRSTLPIPVIMGKDAVMDYSSFFSMFILFGSLFLCSKAAWLQTAAAWVIGFLDEGTAWFGALSFLLIVLLTYFYADINMAGWNYGDKLRQEGAHIPNLVPGAPTNRYLMRVVRRITLPAAIGYGIIVILPWLANRLLGVPLSFLDGASILVCVAIISQIFTQLDTQLRLHGYEVGLIR